MNAVPLNRSPSTATVPDVTVKSAAPRLPAIPDKPGRLLRTSAILLFAASETLDPPSVSPFESLTVIETVVAAALGFTMATAVVKLVSSHMIVEKVSEYRSRDTIGRLVRVA